MIPRPPGDRCAATRNRERIIAAAREVETLMTARVPAIEGRRR